MPPVTPRAISIWYSITRFPGPRLRLDLFHLFRHDFLLRHRRLLVIPDRDARRGAGHELARARAGSDDELERIRQLGTINHENLLTMFSTSARMDLSRARSATTILRNRSTAAVKSSLMTT